MMSRAEQNWPEGMVIEIDGAEVSVLAPYRHELNVPGTRCASDCPACEWSRTNVTRR